MGQDYTNDSMEYGAFIVWNDIEVYKRGIVMTTLVTTNGRIIGLPYLHFVITCGRRKATTES